jgi:hypothetical protein
MKKRNYINENLEHEQILILSAYASVLRAGGAAR